MGVSINLVVTVQALDACACHPATLSSDTTTAHLLRDMLSVGSNRHTAWREMKGECGYGRSSQSVLSMRVLSVAKQQHNTYMR